MRRAGILLPISALPSRYGIGDFGETAYQAVDIIAKMGFKTWQILPLNPLGFGNSPYQPYSSKALDEIYVDLKALHDAGLVAKINDINLDNAKVYFAKARQYKKLKLREAFNNFKPDEEYKKFIDQKWVQEYGLFSVLKLKYGLKNWSEWEECDAIINGTYKPEPAMEKDIEFEMFIQYVLFKQFKRLLNYAHSKGISVMGDVPFYVGLDSSDVLFDHKNFLLDEAYVPTFVAGVPPDYFSETGQRWGNPIYDWDYLVKDNFRFWIDRLHFCADLYDEVRIDHFRAFDTYWKINAECETAVDGEWVEAPGYAFFDELFKQYPDTKIVAEDLGELRKEVVELRDHYHFLGMKVLQFIYNPNGENFDEIERENLIIYTGTHDNQTVQGWHDSLSVKERASLRDKLRLEGYYERNISDIFCLIAVNSIAEVAILAVQDVMGLDDHARINTPGTIGSPNWEFRIKDLKNLECHVKKVRLWLEESKRI